MANFPKIAFVKVDSHEVCHILGSNEDDDPTRKKISTRSSQEETGNRGERVI